MASHQFFVWLVWSFLTRLFNLISPLSQLQFPNLHQQYPLHTIDTNILYAYGLDLPELTSTHNKSNSFVSFTFMEKWFSQFEMKCKDSIS
jgi:hypothetical protein